jgi:adenylate cyclase
VVRRVPASPRCRLCYYPFEGLGGTVARRLWGIAPSKMNPTICNFCEQFVEEHQGGAEVETTVLFADVRGSTELAERMSPAEFGQVIRRFYAAATKALIDHGGMIEKLIGDEVTAFFVTGLSGPDHARLGVDAAQAILRITGHAEPGGPWVPVGVGVHTGQAYIGAVQVDNGAADVVVLGDAANTGARLASLAGPGEVLVSEATRAAAGLSLDGLEGRRLQLKGRSEPVDAWALKVASG